MCIPLCHTERAILHSNATKNPAASQRKRMGTFNFAPKAQIPFPPLHRCSFSLGVGLPLSWCLKNPPAASENNPLPATVVKPPTPPPQDQSPSAAEGGGGCDAAQQRGLDLRPAGGPRGDRGGLAAEQHEARAQHGGHHRRGADVPSQLLEVRLGEGRNLPPHLDPHPLQEPHALRPHDPFGGRGGTGSV